MGTAPSDHVSPRMSGAEFAVGSTSRGSARYYRTARTAHLERLHSQVEGDFYFQNKMYDFDLAQAPASANIRQVKFGEVLSLIWRRRYQTLEIVEPYAPSALPQNLLIALTTRLSALRKGEPTALVTYAIENADLPRKFASEFRLPRWFTRAALRATVGFCFRTLSRIVYGTADAQQNYVALLGEGARTPRKPRARVIEGLSAASCIEPVERDIARPRLIFVGTFDDRKGIREVLAAWPSVRAQLPNARLLVMGKGPREHEIVKTANLEEGIEVRVDPPRDEIWTELSRGTALCLFSQPAPGWKEQIGLPIVEGLSVGLEIIASDETGIAGWLREHGHRVLPHHASPTVLAAQIVAALSNARSPKSVQADLPLIDGRLAADGFLHERTR